ncbi:MAG TPA: GNAT family N-acyltransferase [Pyrinomonadaceae bacterium]|nr:GNAT family N-acyltransferase [Pyrinomonadaceae bacterium]
MRPHKYLVSVAETEAEKQAIYEFRYQVYIEEMGKPYSQADHERKQFSDPLDDRATLLYSTIEGKMLGTVRINWGEDPTALASFAQTCGLADFKCFPRRSLSFTSRLMVHKARRRSPLAVALSTKAYELGRERGTQLNFMHCTPRLLGFFERMGFRQYRQGFEDAEAGAQVPLVLVIEDVDHLRASGSPFLCKALERPNSRLAGLWFMKQSFGKRHHQEGSNYHEFNQLRTTPATA